jgi:excisionase family DNA binding protein
MMRPELEKIDGAPRTAAEFLALITTMPAAVSHADASPLAGTGKLLTIAAAADRMGICRKSMENWARSGKIARVKVGHVVRIPERAIADLLIGSKEA